MDWLERLLPGWVDRDPDGRAFDRQWGTETRWFDLGNYEPTPPTLVDALLDAVPDPERRVFLDLGSGKGRAVLLASRRPFRAAIGIEHRPRLHTAALRNLAAFAARDGPACPVHLLCADVAEQPLPDGPLAVFLFNPFGPDVLRRVLDRVGDRDVLVLYVVPKHLPYLRVSGFREVGSGHHLDLPWKLMARGFADR